MSDLHPTNGRSRGLCEGRFWRALVVVFVVFAGTPLLSAAYLYESVSASVGSDGTIYATGVTNAGGMQQHSAWVSTNIRSPKGRVGSGYQSVTSGGYAVADASLAFDQSDVGDYFIQANGGGT